MKILWHSRHFQQIKSFINKNSTKSVALHVLCKQQCVDRLPTLHFLPIDASCPTSLQQPTVYALVRSIIRMYTGKLNQLPSIPPNEVLRSNFQGRLDWLKFKYLYTEPLTNHLHLMTKYVTENKIHIFHVAANGTSEMLWNCIRPRCAFLYFSSTTYKRYNLSNRSNFNFKNPRKIENIPEKNNRKGNESIDRQIIVDK